MTVQTYHVVWVDLAEDDPIIGSGHGRTYVAGYWTGRRPLPSPFVPAFTVSLYGSNVLWFEDEADAVAVALMLESWIDGGEAPDVFSGSPSVGIASLHYPGEYMSSATVVATTGKSDARR